MKALMEGVGPLAFAMMIPPFESTALPGAPWLVSAGCMAVAFALCCWLEAMTDDAIHMHRGRACCDCSDPEHEQSLFLPSNLAAGHVRVAAAEKPHGRRCEVRKQNGSHAHAGDVDVNPVDEETEAETETETETETDERGALRGGKWSSPRRAPRVASRA